MSLPQFTATTKIAETSTTSIVAIVRAFNTLVTNLQGIFTSLLGRVQLDSVVLQDVPITAGQNNIQHTLGRTLTGWKIVRLNGYAAFYDLQGSNPDPTNYLLLMASANCTVSLEVY
jgi:hypothetical protein